MNSPALVIKPETTVQEISELFGHWKVNRVPVVNEAGRLGGVVSRGDLILAVSIRLNRLGRRGELPAGSEKDRRWARTWMGH